MSASLAYLASDRPSIAKACKECSRAVGEASRADHTRLKRPRAVWEFPPDEESIVTIDGLSYADAAGCAKTRRSTSGGCLRIGQHISATWSSTQKVVSLSSAKSCERGHRVGQHSTRAGTRGSRTNLDGCCSSTRTGSPQWERRHQIHGSQVLLAAEEKNQELGIENIRGTVSPADLMTKKIWMESVWFCCATG